MDKINVFFNDELLSKFFWEESKSFQEKLDMELGRLGFETYLEKRWVCVSLLALGTSLMIDSTIRLTDEVYAEELSRQTKLSVPPMPMRLYEKFRNVKIKDVVGLYYLTMARNTLDISVHTFNEGDYKEGISLSFLAREIFTKYENKVESHEEKSIIARFNAIKRHAETYQLKEQAIDYWCKNIDYKLSNEKAAELLSKIVPVSHRKLSQYVAEAKKQKIHPASKA